jgi:cation diffusion facilitator family transporter
MNPNVLYALLAAALFGASTPFAKLLVGQLSPVLLSGLLYLGSGIGLAFARLIRDRGWKSALLTRSEWPWLIGAIFFGGILGPIALMVGLTHISGSTASLLLNLEAVLTATIAWLIFKENADRRIVLGMVAIVAGGLVLSWPDGDTGVSDWFGPLAVTAACLCWAIDNNLTRKVSASDALFIASSKGLIAGTVNTVLALSFGAMLPDGQILLSIMTLGLFGYGISLVLFVLALRGLGTARTGAYFSTAPFIGAAVAIVLLGESTSITFWLAFILMGLGVWLHLTERHKHKHTHAPLQHTHSHRHDEHHQHQHNFAWDGCDHHEHQHQHTVVTHEHNHFPDIHHRHNHYDTPDDTGGSPTMPHQHSHGHSHSTHAHGGGHHHATPSNYGRAFVTAIGLNTAFVVVEFTYGFIANSTALMADAGHNLSDVLGLFIAWGAAILGRKAPGGRYTYGLRSTSILAALANAMFLLIACGGIAWEAMQRFSQPPIVSGVTIMEIAAIGIVINGLSAWLFVKGSQGDLNIRGAYLHMLADAVVSLGVVAAGIAIMFTHWYWLDPVISLIIVLVIVISTWGLLRESTQLALSAVPRHIDLPAIETYLRQRPGVSDIHDLHIWGMSTTETALTVHLVMPEGYPGDKFMDELVLALKQRFSVNHSTLQIEQGTTDHVCTLTPS